MCIRDSDRVGQVEFELGRIKGAFAFQLFPAIFRPRTSGQADGLAQIGLRPVPHFLGAEAFFRAQRQFDRIALETEILVDRVEQVAECARLVDDLVFACLLYTSRCV